MNKFYRIENRETKQGLWYSYNGEFTGLIHTKFTFCKNYKLEMPYDENVVGYISVTDELTNLYFWFSKEDIEQLYQHGYKVSEYESNDIKVYPNQHLIKQNTAIFIKFIEFDELPPDTINN
jgi:hypothetical protein